MSGGRSSDGSAMSFALYITHPQVQVDPDVPVPQWRLSEVGRARALEAADSVWIKTIGRIVSSREMKAIETADLLATGVDLEIEIFEGMEENDRSTTGFLPPDAFEAAADWFFAHPTESFEGWERAVDAQARIAHAVDMVLADHDPTTPIVFVGHGGVGALLKCHLKGIPISQSEDQPAGGGNLFCFTLADRSVSCDWTPFETWQGEDER
jgi:broad specificity phosphatase PhoE